VVGFIVLVLDIIVFRASPSPVIVVARTGILLCINKADIVFNIVEVLPSNRPVMNKVLWCLLVFFFPIGGMIIYWLFSNRTAHRSGGYEVIG
jgi:Phospholipase_D-nuclease N-terminal